MALTTTTTSAAVGALDNFVNFTSVTSLVQGMFAKIDEEFVKIASSSTALANPVQVIRGQNGTAQVAHVSGANATFGLGSDFNNPNSATDVAYALAGRRRKVLSYGASGAITLPLAGEDSVAILNGTSVLAMTIAAPGKDLDGSRLMVIGNGAAAHTIQFTGGLSGAGANYDVITVNATAPIAVEAIACNGLWIAVCSPAMTGTVTNIVGGVA